MATSEEWARYQALQAQFSGGYDYSVGGADSVASTPNPAAIAAQQKQVAEEEARVFQLWQKNPGSWTAEERAFMRGKIAGAAKSTGY